MDEAEFLVKLLDGVSGPAGKASSASSKLDAELRKQERTLASLDAKHRAAADPLRALESALRKASSAADSATAKHTNLAARLAEVAAAAAQEGNTLSAMQAELDAVSNAAEVNEEQALALMYAIDAQTLAVGRLTSQHDNLAKSVAKAAAAEGDAKGKASALTAELGSKQAGAAAEAKSKIDTLKTAIEQEAEASKEAAPSTASLSEAMQVLGPYAKAAAVAIAAVVAVVVGGVMLAASASQFKAKAIAGLEATLGSAEAARDTFAEVRAISDALPITEAKAQTIAADLLQNNLQRDQLGDALQAVAAIEAVKGEEASSKIQEAIKKSAAAGSFKLEGESLVGTGLDMTEVVAQLATDLGKTPEVIKKELAAGKIEADAGIDAIVNLTNSKFGELGNSVGFANIGTMIEKSREVFMRFFEDVDFGPLTAAVSDLLEVFSDSRPAGQAMKAGLGGAVQGILDGAKLAMPYLKSALMEVIILGLKMYIAFKPAIAAIKEFMGGQGGDALLTTLKAIGTVVGVLILALTYLVGYWIKSVVEGFGALVALGSVAIDFMAGLAKGIAQGAGIVWDAIKAMASGMLTTLKGVLGIASPAKATIEAGEFTAEGMEVGLDNGQGAVTSAMEQLAAPPPLATTVGANNNAGGSSGASFAWSGDLIMGGASPTNAAEMKQAAQEAFGEMLEQFLIHMGGAAA